MVLIAGSIEYYKKSLAISKNEKSFINISTRLIEEKRLNEARNYLNDAIKNNTIGGVALDVFEEEPAKNNILFGLDNVLLTPHIAASTSEAQVIVAEMIANQFVDFFLKNKVNNSVI